MTGLALGVLVVALAYGATWLILYITERPAVDCHECYLGCARCEGAWREWRARRRRCRTAVAWALVVAAFALLASALTGCAKHEPMPCATVEEHCEEVEDIAMELATEMPIGSRIFLRTECAYVCVRPDAGAR